VPYTERLIMVHLVAPYARSMARARTPASRNPTYATPGHLVRRAGQRHNRIFEEEFGGAITPRQFAAVVALGANPGIDQITLGNIVAIDRSTIGGMVERLTKRGLVSQVRDPSDGRKKVLELSPEGRAFLDRLTPKIDRVSARLLEPLTAAERRTFLALLAKVVLIDDPEFPDYAQRALHEWHEADG
jgi:DNA-binding MarR family transcriptional regulator